MYKKLTFLVLLTFLLGLWGCQKKEESQKPASNVVARVNEGVLTEKDMERDIPEDQRSFVTPEQKRGYVKGWIESEILYQEAKRKKIDQDENLKWLIDQTVRNEVIQTFLEKELGARVAVSGEEAKQYYQEHKDEFKREEDEVRLSHILVKNIAEAGLVAVRMQGGERFDMLAKQMSLDSGTKERGGDMGYIPISNLPPQFYEAVKNLKAKEISTPIQTDYGFDIVMVTDKKERGSTKEYELVEEDVTNSLILAKKKKELENLLKELKKTAKIQTFGWASGITVDETK
jgi:parvulin-like peptidyl-prolyl isomerase